MSQNVRTFEFDDYVDFDDETPTLRGISSTVETRPTTPIPPDDVTLDAWIRCWNDQHVQHMERLCDKAKEVTDSRQGQLGLTADATERTPAQAMSFMALQLLRRRDEMNRQLQHMARVIADLRRQESR